MDGNGRWAQRNGWPRLKGHAKGAETVRMVVRESRKLGIRYITLFSFSSENWKRPEDEIDGLMSLLKHHLVNELDELLDKQIRLRCIGQRELLKPEVIRAIEDVEKQTEHCEGMDLILALSYGGRQEIVDATKIIASRVKSGELSIEDISEQDFSNSLYAPDVPDPDLLIRTSNEFRISNFLLWQLAYSEIEVSNLYWPEFSEEEFHRCIESYSKRVRRFGKTNAQISG